MEQSKESLRDRKLKSVSYKAKIMSVIFGIYLTFLFMVVGAYRSQIQIDRTSGLIIALVVWLVGGFVCWILTVTGADYVEERASYSEDPPS